MRMRTKFGVLRAGQAGRVGCTKDLARALPELIDLHLQSGLLAPAGRQSRQHSSVCSVMEHIVCLYSCFSLLFVPA